MIELEQEERPNLMIRVSGEKIKVLLDTWANVNCVSLSLAEKLNLKFHKTAEFLRQAGSELRTAGCATIKIEEQTGETETTQEFYVIENLNQAMILGINALAELRIKMDLEHGTLIHNNGKTSYYKKNFIVEEISSG